MANLAQLNQLAQDFNIDQENFSFHGEHDVVFMGVPDGILPDTSEWSEEQIDEFYDKYGIHFMTEFDCWGFYT